MVDRFFIGPFGPCQQHQHKECNDYELFHIRNVCLLGHSGSGKTSLAESLLFMTGAIDRMGRVADGNTVCDYDPEEVKRQISLSTAVAPIDYKGCRINVLDTPGNFDFNGDVLAALQVADAAVIVLPAKGDISVGAERDSLIIR